jgi:hypothetical protein
MPGNFLTDILGIMCKNATDTKIVMDILIKSPLFKENFQTTTTEQELTEEKPLIGYVNDFDSPTEHPLPLNPDKEVVQTSLNTIEKLNSLFGIKITQTSIINILNTIFTNYYSNKLKFDNCVDSFTNLKINDYLKQFDLTLTNLTNFELITKRCF